MDNTDKTIKMTELVIDALSYAHDNDLDITSQNNVEAIIEAIDPEKELIDQTDVLEFMSLLQATNNLMQADAKKRKSLN